MVIKKFSLFDFFAAVSLLLLFYVVVIHLRFMFLPVFFLALGFISYVASGRKALLLFLFLLPFINATPDLFFNGYPFNYMGIPLFYLSGIILASRCRKEKRPVVFPGGGPYLLFLSLLGISALFMFLHWSNLTLSLRAFLSDTPVAPSGERVSFACIFPVITLALFSLAPFLAFLLRRNGLKEAEIFNPLRAGFAVSFLMALIQKWLNPEFLAQRWWGMEMKQVNGGFSDFNAFGFFAGVMFLYQALRLIDCLSRRSGDELPFKAGIPGSIPCSSGLKKLLPEILFLVIALLAIFTSGCRTAFLFVLFAVLCLLFSKKTGFPVKALITLMLAFSLFFAGGTLITRLKQTAVQAAHIAAVPDLQMAVDEVSGGRLEMLNAGGRMIRRFPLCGIGAGNFLFYLKYLHFGENAYFDLPLNQYLLFFSEIGLIGGLAFLFFLWILIRRLKPGIVRFVLIAMAVALFLNNFFWFPEVLLLFWIFTARAEWPAAPAAKKWAAWAASAILALFVFANITAFHDLNPATWASETSTPYDYGFFRPENESGREFRWSGEKAGIYVFQDKDDPRAMYKLVCSAPLSHMTGNRQTVDVFWRGELYRQILFRENGEYSLPLEDAGHSEGFLEFRVHPSFNLKKMGLGTESRDLGVKVSARAVNFYIDVNEERKEGKYSYRYLSGWLYAKDQETKGQKVYAQFAKPDGSVVHYSTLPLPRPDVGTYFKNALFNVSCFSAAIPLKDGLDVDACMIRFVIGKKINKGPVWEAGIRFNSRAEIEPPVPECRAVSFYVDVDEERGEGRSGYRYLSGWVYVKDQETKGQKVYVQFAKPDGTVVLYTTTPLPRPDVGAYFKNALYNACGFSAAIPLKDGLDVDACTIRFVVGNRNGLYKGPVWKSGVRINSRAEIEPPGAECRAVSFNVDVNEERSAGRYGYRYLSGWVFVKDQETRGQKVYVQFEKPDGTVVLYTTTPLPRPDMGAYFKNALYNACGFSAAIPLKDGLDVDACTIRFVVGNKNGLYKGPVWESGVRINSRAEIEPPGAECRAVSFNVDVNEERSAGRYGYRYLSGWVFVKDQETRGQKVYVQFEKPDGTVVHYTTTPLPRPDMGAYFKNALYDACGFSAAIPLKDGLDVDACTIRFVVGNRNGLYKGPVWKTGVRLSSRVEIVVQE